MKRHKWSDIKARTKPETRTRIEAEARRLSEDLHLSQLRKARGLTQETLAELLGVSQAEVSKRSGGPSCTWGHCGSSSRL
jgi:DNA-binding transcriptional regulator YiaG